MAATRGGGAILVSTSPRTSSAATAALFRAVPEPAFCYRWRRNDPDNPYFALLGLADAFLVTADSASQVIEATLTGKPVSIFDWPLRPLRRYNPLALLCGYLSVDFRDRRVGALRRRFSRWLQTLVEIGIIKPPRDFHRYHKLLRERGLLSDSGASADAVMHRDTDLDRAAGAVRDLFRRAPE